MSDDQLFDDYSDHVEAGFLQPAPEPEPEATPEQDDAVVTKEEFVNWVKPGLELIEENRQLRAEQASIIDHAQKAAELQEALDTYENDPDADPEDFGYLDPDVGMEFASAVEDTRLYNTFAAQLRVEQERDRLMAEAERYAQAAEAQAAQAAQEQATGQAIRQTAEATWARVRPELLETTRDLVARAASQGALVQSPEEVEALIVHSANAAAELHDASRIAKDESLTWADERFKNDGWLGGPNSDGSLSVEDYRADEYAKAFSQAIDPARLFPRQAEELDLLGDERDKILESGAGWNIGGAVSRGAEEDTRKLYRGSK